MCSLVNYPLMQLNSTARRIYRIPSQGSESSHLTQIPWQSTYICDNKVQTCMQLCILTNSCDITLCIPTNRTFLTVLYLVLQFYAYMLYIKISHCYLCVTMM